MKLLWNMRGEMLLAGAVPTALTRSTAPPEPVCFLPGELSMEIAGENEANNMILDRWLQSVKSFCHLDD